jgi:hypothetical protein
VVEFSLGTKHEREIAHARYSVIGGLPVQHPRPGR